MATTAIVDVFCAAFVAITLARNTSEQNRLKSSRLLNLCLCLMLLTLMDDAMSYSFLGPSYPLAFRYTVTLFSFLATSVIAFAYTVYAEELFRENGYTNPWAFRALKTVELVWFLATAYEFITGHLITYDAGGIENLDYSIPAYLTMFQMAVLIGIPVITVINRRRIGVRQTILMCLFNVVPIISSLIYMFLGTDFAYALSAVTLALITVFYQKTHLENLEREYYLQRVREAERERIRKEQIAVMAGGVSAYIVNPKTERFQILSQNSHLAENYTAEEDFNTSFSRYIGNDVFAPDRAMAAEKISIPAMTRALAEEEEYSVRYRDTSAGYPRWYEMRAIRLSEDEILLGFTDREDEINGQMLYDKMRGSYFGLYYINLDASLAHIIKTGHPELTGEAGKVVPYTDLIKNIFSGSEGDALVFLNRISDIDYLRSYFADKDLAYYVYKSYIFEAMKWVTATGMVLARYEDGTPSVFGLGFTLLDEQAAEKEEAKLKVSETLAFTNYLLEPYDSAYYINLSNLSWTVYKRPDEIERNYPTGENYVKSLGRYIAEEVHPDDREALRILVQPDQLKAALREKTQFELRFRKITEDTVKYLHCFVIRGAADDQAALGFLDDTDQVNAELARRKAMQQQLDIIGGLASEYTALFHVDLDTDDYISCHLTEKAGDVRLLCDRFPKFTDLAHGFAGSDRVRPEDRESLCGFYLSAEAVRERMKDRKMDSMLFKRNYGGEFLWTEITIVKCEDIDEEAHNIIVGFVEKDREVRERTERFREEDEIQKLIDSITSDFNIVYIIDMASDTYEIHRMDADMLESGCHFATFSEARDYTVENIIHPRDRERMRREFDFDTIRRNLTDEPTRSTEYRLVKNGNTLWGEMKISYAGGNRIILGMKEKNLETAKRLIEEKRFDENFALFEVDIDREKIRILKNNREYQTVPVGESAPYTQYIREFASHFEDEVKEFFLELSDMEFIKSEFAKDDKRTYSFRSHFLERHQWVDMTSYVILRHEDGTPAMFTIAFSLADALATIRQELQTRMKEDMHMIGGITSGYNALYYINIDENLLHIYALDETKYPGSKAIFEGEEKNFYRIIGGYGLSEQVHPDDRHLFEDFGPEWIREKLTGRKKYSMRFRAAAESGYRWDELELTKYEDIDTAANAVVIGFTDRDADIRSEQAINSSFDVLGRELPPDEAIHRILSIAGDFYGAERCYVFEYVKDVGIINNTYEWCADGIQPMAEKLQKLPADVVEGWNREFSRRGAFCMDALDSEHNTRETADILEMQGVESLVAAPLMNGDEIVGFIGVDNPTKAKKDISILEKASSVVYSEILKRKENDEEHITLGKLTEAFLSVYYVDLSTDYMKTWKIADEYKEAYGAVKNYSVSMGGYVRENIAESDRERCIEMTSPEYVLEQFRTADRFSIDMTDIMLGYERSVVLDYIKVNESGTQFVVCGRDVSETLAKEREQVLALDLANQQRHIKAFGDMVNAALWSMNINDDNEVVEVFWSDEFRHMFGFADEADFPNTVEAWSSRLHPEDKEATLKNFAESINSRDTNSFVYDMEYRILRKNNEYCWYHAVGRMENNDDGTRKMYGIIYDISVDKKLEEQQKLLEEARVAAEAANKSKTSFLFNMSHDIRTPMNAITGFTNMAKKHIDDREKVADYLEKIDTSGQQLLTLVNQVLEMARIESGKIEIEENPVNVREEYEAAVTVLAEQAKVCGLSFDHSLSNITHYHILADAARMNSITLNITGNAMKYTPRGGNVEFSLKELPSGKEGYARYVFTVADTGIGMSEEYQKVLFEPFTREKSSTVSKIQGTGLGMSIVKELVDLLGGNIEVHSELGRGTRFDITVDFKIDERASDASGAAEAEENVSLAGHRALLVEDNELNREIALEILGEDGLIVDEADDGTTAVDMLKDKGPDYYDFILMDIQMPVMDGYEATKVIRGMYPEKHIPIIALSANAFAEDKSASIAAGMDDHVAKPINIRELHTAIARLL